MPGLHASSTLGLGFPFCPMGGPGFNEGFSTLSSRSGGGGGVCVCTSLTISGGGQTAARSPSRPSWPTPVPSGWPRPRPKERLRPEDRGQAATGLSRGPPLGTHTNSTSEGAPSPLPLLRGRGGPGAEKALPILWHHSAHWAGAGAGEDKCPAPWNPRPAEETGLLLLKHRSKMSFEAGQPLNASHWAPTEPPVPAPSSRVPIQPWPSPAHRPSVAAQGPGLKPRPAALCLGDQVTRGPSAAASFTGWSQSGQRCHRLLTLRVSSNGQQP